MNITPPPTDVRVPEDTNLAEALSRMEPADTAYRAALGVLGTSGKLSLMDYLR